MLKDHEWSVVKLNDLGFVGRGKSRHRPRNDASLYGGPYPFIQTADIMASDLYITSYSQTYSEVGLQQSKMWDKNTLCMTIAGENTGEVALLGFKACFPDSVIAFVPDPAKADVRFVKYYFDTMKGRIKSISRGATQDNLSLYKLLSLDLRVPVLPLQRRIGDILSAYDDLIENNTRRIKIFEDMAQMIFREWFVNFRFPGHDKVRMVESELGPIPEGWAVQRLDAIFEFQNRSVKAGPKLEGFRYLPIDCLPQKSLALRETKPLNEAQSSLHLFAEGDVLFGAMRAYFHKVIVAPFNGVTRKTCFVLKTRLPEYHAFSALTMFQDDTVAYAAAHSNGSTIPYAVWGGALDGMPIITPPPEIARKFQAIVDPMIGLINKYFFINTNLRTTRNLLLPKLISGEVPVDAAAELMEQTA